MCAHQTVLKPENRFSSSWGRTVASRGANIWGAEKRKQRSIIFYLHQVCREPFTDWVSFWNDYHLLRLIPKATPISKVKSRERARLLFIEKRAVLFFLELVSNKNTPLEAMKGLQRVHFRTNSVLFVNRYLLLVLFSCPVCRYCQTPQPVDGNKCFECDSNEVQGRLPIYICHMWNTRQRAYHISNIEKRADKTILWKVFLTIVDMLWWNSVLSVRSNFRLILGVKTYETHEWRKTMNTKKPLGSQQNRAKENNS